MEEKIHKVIIIGNAVLLPKCLRFFTKYRFQIAGLFCEDKEDADILERAHGITTDSLGKLNKDLLLEQGCSIVIASANCKFQFKMARSLHTWGIPRKRIIIHNGLWSDELDALLNIISISQPTETDCFVQYLLARYPESGAHPLKFLAEFLIQTIKQDIDPKQQTIAIYYPDKAYRANLGNKDTYEAIRGKGYNVILLFGEKSGDQLEQLPYSYFVGQGYNPVGLLNYLDFIDLFILPSIIPGLPKNSKKLHFPHDIFDSPVGPEWSPILSSDGRIACEAPRVEDLDYIFMPSALVGLESDRRIVKRKKPLVRIPGGYLKLDSNIKLFMYNQLLIDSIIYAPTVAKDNFTDYVSLPLYGKKIVGALLENFPDYNIIFRPHPHTLGLSFVGEIVQAFESNPKFIFDNTPSFYMDNYARSAVMVSDMSGTAFTFAFSILRPVVFFSHNENPQIQDVFGGVKYFQYRSNVGYIATTIDEMVERTKQALVESTNFRPKIETLRNSIMYNIGHVEDYFLSSIDTVMKGEILEDWQEIPASIYCAEIEDPTAVRSPEFIEPFNGYNLVYFNNHFIGISKTLGLIDIGEINQMMWKQLLARQLIIEEDSITSLKKTIRSLITEFILKNPVLNLNLDNDNMDSLSDWQTPKLLEEGYKGYNIVFYQFQYHALSQNLGAIEIASLDNEDRASLTARYLYVVGITLGSIKQQIDSLPYSLIPQLIEEGYKGFNLVFYHSDYHALSQKLGPFDIRSIDDETRSILTAQFLYLVGNSIEDIIIKVDELIEKTSAHLIDPNYFGYQIFTCMGNCFGHSRLITIEDLESADQPILKEYLESAKCFIGKTSSEVSVQILNYVELLQSKVFDHPVPFIDWKNILPEGSKTWRVLFITDPDVNRSKYTYTQLPFENIDLLIPKNQKDVWRGGNCSIFVDRNGNESDFLDIHHLPPGMVETLKQKHYDLAIVSYGPRLGVIQWEKFVDSFAPQLLGFFFDGSAELFNQDQLKRMLYNLSYMRSMLHTVQSIEGMSVIEVGCSDGLTCRLALNENPHLVVGFDYWFLEGTQFRNARIPYTQGNAINLPYQDQVFDLSYSIATFEHVAEPYAALLEMRRVTRQGGYIYIQAGPLYHSPFGHHMFSYFSDFPWIHLRLSKQEIVEYCDRSGISERIEKEQSRSAQQYIFSMINSHHINGKLLSAYGINDFSCLPGVETIFYRPSYEGNDLWTSQVQSQVHNISRDDLVAHGFEVMFRVF